MARRGEQAAQQRTGWSRTEPVTYPTKDEIADNIVAQAGACSGELRAVEREKH
jgi:hypothetical protein